MKKRQLTIIVFGGCLLLLWLELFWNQTSDVSNILFSWKRDAVVEKSQLLFQTAKEQNINIIYQSFNQSLSNRQIAAFIQDAISHDIEIYLLDGKPSWGTESNGESMKKVLERVDSYNKENLETPIKGVLLDVEPYTLDNWEDDQNSIMEDYLSGVKETYYFSREMGIEFALCISCFYDTWGYEDILEQLIQHCDTVVVMNYQRGNELKQLKTEASFAKKYEKQIINVYELQKEGEHGITERNTYYHVGLDALYKNFKELKKELLGVKLSYGLHEFEALQEVIGYE